MALHNNRRNSGVKNQFFLYKNFNFCFFLMVFNAIDSPALSNPDMLLWSIALF